ncbi:MAG: hypothetical protein ACXVIG_06670 [Halobacteriota archaeon]
MRIKINDKEIPSTLSSLWLEQEAYYEVANSQRATATNKQRLVKYYKNVNAKEQ